MRFFSSNFFIPFFLIIIVVICAYRYNDYVVNKNFLLVVNTSCNTYENGRCFVSDCQGSSDCDITPYKKITIYAKVAPVCLGEHSCQNFSCTNTNNCKTEYCLTENVSEGEICSNN